MKFNSMQEIEGYLKRNPNLTELLIHSSPGLAILPALPGTLTSLYVVGCTFLTSLPELPSTLAWLQIENCPEVPRLTVRQIVKNCRNLRRLCWI